MNNVKRKRNMLTVIAVIAMVALCFGMLVACNKTVENQGTGTFNIVFDYNDGSDTTVTQSFRFEEIQLYQPPTREGYNFLSWTLDREGEQQLTVETLQNGMTLYAQWSIKTYTVRFNDAEGNLMSSQKVGYGRAAIAPSQEEIASHVQEGYAFVGWNKAFDSIKSDLTVTMLVEESISTYKVDFVYGDKVIASFVGEEGDRIPQNVNAPKKDGFTFANWKTQNGDVFDSTSKFVANTTYYANFVITAPTAPTIVAQNSVVYGNSIALSVENEEEFEGLTYKYEWLLNDVVIGEGKNFTVTDKLNVNNYNVKVRVSASCEGYAAKQTTSQPKAIAVEKATLTATLQPITLTYGDEVPAKTAYVLVYSGFKFDDDESVLDTSNASFETTYVKGSNVGSSYVATASGIDADNYTVNFVSAVITVVKKTINVNAQSFEAVYNPDVEKVEKSATLASDKVSGLLNNHTITLTFSAKGKNVGEYTGDTLTASYSVSNGEINVTNNYDVVIAKGSKIDVLPANIVYSLPENNTFTYDALGHGNGITVESKGIQITYTVGENVSATAPTFTNAGEYTVHAVMENPNYNTAKVDYSVVINRASVKVIAKSQNTVYGDDFTLARDYEIQKDFSANITIDGLTLTTAYESGMNVGKYDITVVITGENANFDITTEKATLTVAQRALNVTIADASVVYGNDFTPTLSLATVEGLIEGDDAGLTLGTSYVKANATAGKDETITCAISNENYQLNANTATLTVEKRALTIAIDNASISYGSTFGDISHSIVNGSLANGDEYVATKDCNYSVGDDVDSYSVNAIIAIANGNADKTGNYVITVEQGTLTVNPLEISVAIDGNADKSITYGEALPEITASYSGDKYALDSINVSPICNYVAGNNIGEYGITLGVEITRDGNDKSGNYVINRGTGTLTVNKRAVTVKLDEKSTTYGENAPELTYTVEGTFASTDNAVIAPTTTYVKGMPAKPYPISATTTITSKNGNEDKSANYDITTQDNSLTVGKRAVTVNANSGNIKYGETFEPSYERIGEFAEDDEIAVNLDCAYAQGSNAGNYAISASVSITRNGEDYSNNYALTVNGAELTVAKRNITVKALGATINYGDDFAIAYENNLEDLADIDQIDVSTSCAYLTAKATGTYQLNPSVKITRKIGGIAQNDNYVIDITNATLVVDKLALSLTLNDATITYGDAFEPQYTLTGDVANGENANVKVNCAYLTAKSAGTFDITASVKVFNGTTETTANYDIATIESKTLTVNKKALNVSIANASVVYGEDFTPALSLATVEGLIDGDDAGLTLDTSYVKANAIAGVDETITCAISNENYQLNANTATLTVEKRALTIAIGNASIAYGSAFGDISHSIVNGSLANDDAYVATKDCNYTVGDDAKSYNINAIIAIANGENDKTGNYDITVEQGTLTVNPLEISVAIDGNANKSVIYGNELPEITASYTGDKYALDSINVSPICNYVAGNNIGEYGITLGVEITRDGNDKSSNYIINYGTGTLTVNKRNIAITLESATTTYGEDAPTLNYTINGTFADTDNAVITPTTTYVKGNDATTYTISATNAITSKTNDEDKSANYAITVIESSLTVGKRNITITANDGNIKYGEAFAPSYEKVGEFADGDEVSVKLACDYTQGSNAGYYDITASVEYVKANANNYTIALNNAKLNVAKRKLSLTLNDATITYGDAFEPQYTLTGEVANGENANVKVNCAYLTAKSAGSFDISASVKVFNETTETTENYEISTIENKTLTVDKKALNVSIANASVVYGEDFTPALSLATVDGLIDGDDAGLMLGTTYVKANATAGKDETITCAISNENYQLNANTATLTVEKRALTITLNSANVIYGNALPTLTYATDGELADFDETTVTPECEYVAGTGAGVYENYISANVAINRKDTDTNVKANYDVRINNGTLTVSKRTATVEHSMHKTQKNDGAYAQFDIAPFVNNAFASDVFTGTLRSASAENGTYNVVGESIVWASALSIVDKDGNDASENYNVEYKVEIVIDNALIGYTKTNYSGIYDAQPHTGSVNVKDVENYTIKYSVDNVNFVDELPSFTNVGNYTVYFEITTEELTPTNGSFTVSIDKKAITLGIERTVDYYDAFVPSADMLSVDSYVIDDLGLSVVCEYAQGKNIGDYAITYAYANEDKIANYTVTLASNVLHVVAKEVAVTYETAHTINYGDAFVLPTFTTDFELANEYISLVTTYTQGANAGNYPITVNCASNNYTLKATNGNIEVKPIAIGINVANGTTTYGDAFTPSYAQTGNVASIDEIVVTLACGYEAGSTVGTYPITASVAITRKDTDDSTLEGNYNVTVNNGTLTVNKRALSLTLNDATITYGDTFNPQHTLTGEVANGENANITVNCAYLTTKAAGSFDISASVKVFNGTTETTANYDIATVESKTLTVDKKALNVSIANASVVYGNHFTPSLSLATVEGLIDGDNAGLTLATTYNMATAKAGDTYAITCAISNDNYQLNANTSTLTVEKRALTITVEGGSIAYGSAFNAFNHRITSGTLANDDEYTAIKDCNYTVGNSITTETNKYYVGATVSIANGTDDRTANYNITVVQGELTVNPLAITANVKSASITYWDALPTFETSISGTTYAQDSIVITPNCKYAQGSDVGNYGITLGVAITRDDSDMSGNYVITYGTGTLAVNAKEVAVTYETAHTINYGDAFVLPTFTTDFERANEYISLATTYTQGANAGNYAITVNCTSNNYTLIATEGNITVKPIAIGINVAIGTTTYGDAFTPSYAQTGNVASIDEIVVTLACGYEAGSTVGTYPITASVAITRKDTGDSTLEGNYNVTVNNGTLTVNKREIVVSLDDGKEVNLARRARATDTNAFGVMYGEAFNLTQSLTGNFASADNGVITVEHGYSVGSPYGNYDITAFVKILRDEEDMSANYVVKTTNDKVLNGTAQVVGSLTVAKRDITFTVNSNVNGTFYYGDTLAPSYTQSGSGIASVDESDISIVCGYLTSPKFGEFEITVSVRIQRDGTDVKANYNVVINASSITVEKRPVTVTLADQTVVYGDDFTVPTYNVDYEPARKDITITTTYNKTTAVGRYDFTTNCSNDNYAVTWNVGKLTVNKKDVHVSVANTVVTYGDALNATFTCDVENARQYIVLNHNYKQGDGVGDKNYAFSLACGNVNYNLIATLGTLTVVQRNVTISANNITATYGDTIPTATFNVVGEYSGAPIDRTLISVEYTGTGVGSHDIDVSTNGLESAYPNYTFTTQKGTLTVNKAKLTATITLANNSIVYGDEMPSVSVAYAGFVNGENESVLKGTLVVNGYAIGAANGGVGTHTITVSGISADNYDITFGTATLNVAKKALTVLATVEGGTTITYGDAIPSITFIGFKEGLVAGDNFDASSITFAFDNYNTTKHTAGANKALKATCAAAVNYTFGTSVLDADTQQAITLTVNKAPLTITINQPSAIVYGGAVPNFTCTVDGLVDNGFINDSALANSVAISTTYTQGSNVGSYRVYADVSALESIFVNYTVTATNECTLTVNKANYTAEEIANIKHRTLEIMYAPGNTLALLTLDSNFTWKDATQNIGDAGTHTFTAIYGGDSNHNPCEVSITVVVTKSNNVEITHNSNTEVQYGNDLSLTSIYNAQSTNPQNNAITYNITTPGHVLNNATAITDGGVYTIEMKSAETSNYVSVSKTVTLKVKFAKIGSTYYTVEDALSVGGTITLDGNAFVSSNVEVKSGTTLILPSSADTSTTVGSPTHGAGQKKYVDTDKTYIEHVLTIDNGVTVTVNGTILVNGLLGAEGGILEGHTSGAHSQIVNNGTMTFNSGAKLDMRGYVKGNGTAYFNNGSVVYSPFVVKDFRGGTNTTVVYKNKNGVSIAPFSQYEMPNIQCEQYYYYGSKLTAYFDLYASSSHNTSSRNMISIESGSDNQGLIKLGKEGDYVRKLYDRTSTKTTYTLVGDVVLNALTLKVASTSVSMSSVIFPIPWLYDIHIGNGTTATTLATSYKYKLMTGASLTIEKNATLTLNSGAEAIVYSQFTDTAFGGAIYPNKDSAKFIVNGTLIVKNGAKFGGEINSTANGATVTFESGSTLSLSSKEGHGTASNTISALIGRGEFVEHATITEVARIINGDGSTTNASANTTYTYNGEKWA